MSGKYAFTQTLKEVRFLFCQTAEHSGPTRFVLFSQHDLLPSIAIATLAGELVGYRRRLLVFSRFIGKLRT